MFFPQRIEEFMDKNYPYLMPAIKGVGCDTMAETALTVGKLCKAHDVPMEDALDAVGAAHFLHLWRGSGRMVYRIDPTLAQTMQEQAVGTDEDDTLPAEYLLHLPFRCIAVEGPPFAVTGTDPSTGEIRYSAEFSGCFLATAAQPDEFSNGWPSLSCLFETPDGSWAHYYLPVEPNASLARSAELLLEYYRSTGEISEEVNMETAAFEAFPPLYAAQLILYIQSSDADIKTLPSPQPTKRRKGMKRPPRPPKVMEVGYHIGAVLRANTTRTQSGREQTQTGSTVRPHPRRGHWHHYWTGPKSDPSGRKLVLKWTHPTFVHPDGKDDLPTVRPVKSDESRNKKPKG